MGVHTALAPRSHALFRQSCQLRSRPSPGSSMQRPRYIKLLFISPTHPPCATPSAKPLGGDVDIYADWAWTVLAL
jgi:hypothetical protein